MAAIITIEQIARTIPGIRGDTLDDKAAGSCRCEAASLTHRGRLRLVAHIDLHLRTLEQTSVAACKAGPDDYREFGAGYDEMDVLPLLR
ncbi:MAG TPA: hypothetical protein VJT10_10295, partial [Steroidobacteraceae bacterium]|nr:hypothetical protein [Steroidobacteraceae bacterium]